MVESLVQKGADTNLPNKTSTTPLYFAALYGYRHVVRFLLQHGADIEAKTKEGETALMAAICYHHSGVVEELVRRYACVGGLAEAITRLGTDVLEVRNNELITILKNPHLRLPKDLQREVSAFVSE